MSRVRHNKHLSAFTLLEIIIVVIIVAFLAALAIPVFIKSIEFSRSQEAFGAMTHIREALERCKTLAGSYDTSDCGISVLDVDNPTTANLAHFSYTVNGAGTTQYTITATRTTFEYNGNGASTLNTIVISYAAGVLTRSGTGNFSGLK